MPSIVKTEVAQPRQIRLPQLSYGPFILFETLPWLLIATLLRFRSNDARPLHHALFMLLEYLFIILAFLVAARRMVEITDRQTKSEYLSFAKQLILATDIFGRVFLLMFAISFAAFHIVGNNTVSYVILGLDGIAYDQVKNVEFIWSSVLAAIILLMVVTEKSNRSSIWNALKELALRFVWIVPAIFVVILLQIGVSYFQELARGIYVHMSVSQFINQVSVFFFVLIFASIRLWGTLAILTLALSESDRRRAQKGRDP